ncbi:hypothetical protein RZS08_15805, partial [Arthrospira platensis SPKY1]|nr:hypothetical protein [Arthrospira platensis SPKY1]
MRDYRASLIRHTYEKILIEQLLDSTVTQAQLDEYYQLNKEQFPLSTDIARCRFVKLPLNSPDLNQFEKWWKSDQLEDFQQLVSYSNEHAVASVLDDSLWLSMPEIGELWPGGINELRNLQPGQKRTFRDDTFRYYFQLNEIMREKEIAPVGYVADQLR